MASVCMRRMGTLGVVGWLLAASLPAWGATFTVNATADLVDAIPGDGVCAAATGACTLRAAVMEANAIPGVDAVSLPAGTFRLSRPGANEDDGLTGDLDVLESMTISGVGSGQTIVDGSGADRIFDVLGASDVVLAELTLRRGSVPGGNGGAVRHAGPAGMSLTNVRLERNFAGTGAGLHHTDGALAISGGAFEDNVAGYAGGAIYKAGTGTLVVSGASFTANLAAGGPGGAIAFDGPEGVTVTSSQFASNSGGGGGALAVNQAGGLIVGSCTFTDSQSFGNGGALAYTGPGGAAISDSSFAGSVAGGSGGGLFVDIEANLEVSGTTFSENAAGNTGGALYFNSPAGGFALRDGAFTANGAFAGAGGALYAYAAGPVAVANVEVRGNLSVSGGGGGILYSQQAVSLATVRVLDNATTENAGGGLYVNAADPSAVANSTFSGNRVDDGDGGGLVLVGGAAFDIQNCTFAGNLVGGGDGQGGGLVIASGEQSNILNSTFSGNQAAYQGGGLLGGSDITVYSATFAGNAAYEGGSIYNGSVLRVGNTILGGAGGGNCAGNMLESGNRNIDTDGSCELDGPSDQEGVDPLLRPLADNGGPTPTHAIGPQSPAVDSGNPTACTATDQRGIARPADGNGDGDARCDIGAYEYFDQCPGDPQKVDPGACGCGNVDADDNGNGVADCQVNAELKARITRARAILAALTSEKSAEQKALRAELKKLASSLGPYVSQHRKGLALADPGANPVKLAKAAARGLKAAIRARGAKLESQRPKAGGALERLSDAVAS